MRIVFLTMHLNCATNISSKYASFLLAGRAIDGSDGPSSVLSISVLYGAWVPVSAVSYKYSYTKLLELFRVTPHCFGKFRPGCGELYWPSIWSQLFLMPLDRAVIDLSWQVSHGARFTMDHLASFGYILPTACFCGSFVESAEQLFFHCPLAKKWY